MNLAIWFAIFLACSLFWAWLLFGSGAERLEGSFLAEFFLYFGASTWPAEGIRLFALVCWLLQGGWFVVGLFDPEARLFWL